MVGPVQEPAILVDLEREPFQRLFLVLGAYDFERLLRHPTYFLDGVLDIVGPLRDDIYALPSVHPDDGEALPFVGGIPFI